MSSYSIVIPVYKSGQWIPELCERIRESMGEREFELILVNDNSPDSVTWPSIIEVSKNYPFVRGFDLLYNVGQFRAIIYGISEAKGDFIITMDDDLQHPPEEIPKLISAMENSPDMDCIIGAYKDKKHTAFRNLGSRFCSFNERFLW